MRNVKFIWRKLNNSILIYDSMGSELLIRALGIHNYFVMNIRNSIYIDFVALLLTPFIFFKIIIKRKKSKIMYFPFFSFIYIWRALKLGYFLAFCLRHKYKAVLTFADDSPIFHLAAMHSQKQIPFIAVQNGNRFFPNPFEVKENRNGWFGNLRAFHQYYFSMSKYETELFKKPTQDAKFIIPIGSLRALLWWNDVGKKISTSKNYKWFDLCVITTGQLNDNKSQRIMAGLVKRLSESTSLKIVVCTSITTGSRDFDARYKAYKDIYGKRVIIYPMIESETYTLAFRSKVVISAFSTVLRELMGVGCKVYPLNYDGDLYGGPYKLFEECGMNLSPDFNFFYKTIFNLLSVSYSRYKNRYENAINKLSSLDPRIYSFSHAQKQFNKILLHYS